MRDLINVQTNCQIWCMHVNMNMGNVHTERQYSGLFQHGTHEHVEW